MLNPSDPPPRKPDKKGTKILASAIHKVNATRSMVF
jgi:hypothetical protein